ncbi:MAG: hypothetical protein A3H96_08630 [Acidobacteria bacterium RIFCSPLOWO2_02_FULL_67_36]|nr:MAG: hypothetical protein A3H96_08630 [Acidobacteria bacterium RIFCSPLOWO2_02_FULL_67_36]
MMAKAVAARPLGQSRSAARGGHGLLHDALVRMETGRRPIRRIRADPRRRKHELPSPLRRGVRILAVQCLGQHHAADPGAQISLMLAAHAVEVSPQRLHQGGRKQRRAILLPLAAPHHDGMPLEIEILHPQFQTLAKPQARAVQQRAMSRIVPSS